MTRPRMSSKISLVAIDLDGTLLTDKKAITEHTCNTLATAVNRGVHIVIASARPPRSVRPFHKQLALKTLTINYNGALIWNEIEKKPVEHIPLAPGFVRRVILFARGYFPNVLVSCEVLDKWYTDHHEQTYTTETGRLFKPDLVAPLDQFLNEPITKLMLLGDQALVTHLIELLRKEFSEKCSIVRSDPELIQITHPNATKALALLKVAEHYKVPMEEVMAIGDAENDLTMLQSAALSVAMENAHKKIKHFAHWIAPSNNDHGVAAAIERFVLS
jgi:5-amino-6-(5-phospho-D-ribitylamino)uracil phosphatase